MLILRKFDTNTLQICPSRLSDVKIKKNTKIVLRLWFKLAE